MKLILVRHGETQENVDGIVQGWFDSELNKTGIHQAKDAANDFYETIDAIYSSDLNRCLKTAEFFTKKYSNIPFRKDERLRERNFGDAQNTHKDLHDWEVFWAAKDTVPIPNAETLNEYTDRVQDFLEDLKLRHQENEKLLIITHGGTINRVLGILNVNNNYQATRNCESIFVDLIEK